MPGESWGSPNFPRLCTWVRLVEKPTGRAFYVFNVHLQHDAGTDPELARVKSVELLTSRIAQRQHDDPVIVLGDFNATEDEVPIGHLTVTGPLEYCPRSTPTACRTLTNEVALQDAYRALERGPATGTRCLDDGEAGRRVEHVFVSPVVRVRALSTGTRIGGRCASDHHSASAVVDPWPHLPDACESQKRYRLGDNEEKPLHPERLA